jgi:LysR family transcriptional regulator, transcriptional activator for bauABCD operon
MTHTDQKLTERDLRGLRVFRAAVESNGFAAAERTLGMSKASISRHIREVEEKLGARLCERGPSGFSLTSAGRAALASTIGALDALERIRRDVDAANGVLSGTVCIGMGDHILANPACKVSDALAKLQAAGPAVHIRLITLPWNQLGQALMERRVDIAIQARDANGLAFRHASLFAEVQKFYQLAQGGKQTGGIGKGSMLPLVYRPGQPFVEDALKKKLYRKGPEAQGLESVATLVAAGGCVGLLPTHYAEQLLGRFSLEEVPDMRSYRTTFTVSALQARTLAPCMEFLWGALIEAHRKSTDNG